MRLYRFSVLFLLLFAMAVLFPKDGNSVVPPKIDYKIRVTLNVKDKILYGQEEISYTSGADIPLNELYLYLYPNAFRGRESTYGQEAERKLRDYSLAHSKKEGLSYIRIDSLSINGRHHKFKIDDIIMKIELLEPLMPGEKVELKMNFLTKIPANDPFVSKNFLLLAASMGCPQMEVYDNEGWHIERSHLFGSYYGDFATYDVSITLPQEYYVGSTGYLVEAINGDNDIPPFPKGQERKIIREKYKEKRDDKSPTKTLVFHAENVTDFALIGSPDYVKDEAEWNGIKITILVFKQNAKKWKNLLTYTLETLKYFSERIGPYPYPTLTVAEACLPFPAGGMEVSGISMVGSGIVNSFSDNEYFLAHEICHNWIGAAVASDAVTNIWLTEGLTDYLATYYRESNKLAKGSLRFARWFPIQVNTTNKNEQEVGYLGYAVSGKDKPVTMSAYEVYDFLTYQAIFYNKGARVLDMLNYVMGDSLFSELIKSHYTQYKFKHPTTEDFQKVAEEVSGQKLNWFFEEWLYTTKKCDYAVGKISKEKTTNGDWLTNVEIKRKGEAVMPVEVEATLENGEKKIEKIFADDKLEVLTFNTKNPVRKIRIDPNHQLLEINRLNNQSGFLPPIKFSISPYWMDISPETDYYWLTLKPSVWYNEVDKLKLGAKLQTGSLAKGDRFSLGTSYTTKTENLNYNFEYGVPIKRAKEYQFGSSLGKDNGERHFDMKASKGGNFISRSIGNLYQTTHYPVLISFLEFSYSDKYDSRYFDEKWFSLGKTSIVSLNNLFINKSYHGFTRLNLDLSRGLGILDADYAFNRVFASASQEFRLIRTGELIAYVRGSAGYEDGNPPNQEKLDVALGVPKSSVDPVGSLMNRGGGGVRGYKDRAILGKELFALNLELRSEILKGFFITPSLFFDLGRVKDNFGSEVVGKYIYDAGVEFKFLDILYLSFPLWLSEPEVGEKEFDLRALVGVTFEL